MIRRVVAFALAFAALSASSRALETNRLAVEVLPGETPTDAVLAFEEACWTLGTDVRDLTILQRFSHHDRTYVRMAVAGPDEVVHCFAELGNRHGVDGTFEWADGFQGGLVVPSEGAPDRVPDSEWIAPAEAYAPKPDDALVDRLANGETDALSELAQRGLEESLADLGALAERGDAKTLAVLELIASKDPRWPMRRTALNLLDPSVSASTILFAAQNDPAWQVRHRAVQHVRLMVEASGLPGVPADVRPEQILVDLAAHDPAWQVRRQALWQLSSAAVTRAKATLTPVATSDGEPRVRAAALEVLAGADALDHKTLRSALNDPSAAVRTSAAGALARNPQKDDVPALWAAMTAPERAVRLAAGAVLDRIDDESIGPTVWALYQREANELDAVQVRLATRISPDEKRVLFALLRDIDSGAAEVVLDPLLDAKDPAMRALAAEEAPSSSATKTKRRALLADANGDVRAAAILGMCRLDRASLDDVKSVELDPTPLGMEAAHVRQECGRTPREPARWSTALLGGTPSRGPLGGKAPALLGMALLLVSVVLLKLKGAGT